MCLDDAFEHEVWNTSDERRVILIVDIFHPDFSDKEVEWMEETRRARFAKMARGCPGDLQIIFMRTQAFVVSRVVVSTLEATRRLKMFGAVHVCGSDAGADAAALLGERRHHIARRPLVLGRTGHRLHAQCHQQAAYLADERQPLQPQAEVPKDIERRKAAMKEQPAQRVGLQRALLFLAFLVPHILVHFFQSRPTMTEQLKEWWTLSYNQLTDGKRTLPFKRQRSRSQPSACATPGSTLRPPSSPSRARRSVV